MTASCARGPLRAVLAAFADGAANLADVSARTGLSLDLVRGAVDHLVRIGRVDVRKLSGWCASGDCGSCSAGGCSVGNSGPVLVEFTLHRPTAL